MPTPTPTANDDLIAPLVSESFANDAAFAGGTYPKSGASPNLSGGRETATFSYNAATQAYTLVIGGRSITFLPSQIDASQSNAESTTYKSVNGSTTDFLTLTKAGTSGRFTFRYVGGGFWQRTVDGATSVAGNIDSFAYGVPAPAAAVPGIGRAEYLVDFIGAESIGLDVVGTTGTGKVQIDLSTGMMSIQGLIGPVGSENRVFNGNAKITSGSNSISGSFSLGLGPATVAGGLGGRFYGPQGEEIGLAFGGSDSSHAYAATGVILGRGGLVQNLPFDPAKANADVAGLSLSYDQATNTIGSPAVISRAMEVTYDAGSQTYTLINAERSYVAKLHTQEKFGFDVDFLTQPVQQNYTNMTAIRWIETRYTSSNTINGSYNSYTYDIVSGTRTPNANVPRTGTGGFDVNLTGTLATIGASEPKDFFGSGTALIDFASGALTTSGTVAMSSGPLQNGDFSGTAQLSATANEFGGTMAIAPGGFSGSWNGHFYGSDASELGSAFSLTDSSGNVATGLLLGKANPDLVLNYTGLLDLTAAKTFPNLNASQHYTNTFIDYNSMPVTYDPVAQTYKFTTGNFTLFNVPDILVGPSNIVSADSDEVFTHYLVTTSTSSGTLDSQNDVKVLKPGAGNTAIALTYASFATVFTQPDAPYDQSVSHFAFAWGMNTPAAQVPRTGTATYTGILSGGGRILPNVGSPTRYTLSGTTIFNMDFAGTTMDGSFSMIGTEVGSSATRDFGTLPFSGSISSSNTTGISNLGGSFIDAQGYYLGKLNGSFFGPQGPEIAGVFVFDRYDGNETMALTGAFAAKKVP